MMPRRNKRNQHEVKTEEVPTHGQEDLMLGDVEDDMPEWQDFNDAEDWVVEP